jgi:hypothetical protein
VLDFAPPGRTVENSLVPGTCLDAELVFWPGALPQRALVTARYSLELLGEPGGYPGLEPALAAYGAAVAANPWLERFLMPLLAVCPVRQGQDWLICDGDGRSLPATLAEADGWRLLALGGGRRLPIAAEWDGRRLNVLAAWADGQLIPFGGPAVGGGR